MEHVRITNTPYDDVFRTLLNDCSPLIIPVINEMFGEHYSGQEKIIFSPNEHFLNQQGGNEEERITDTSFKILGNKTKKYHFECQSSADNSMLIRFFEYNRIISEYTKCTIIDMTNKVLEHIAMKFDSVKEGVKSVMGGKVLEYEAKTIKREGIKEGMEEGIKGTVSILKNLGIPQQTILVKIQEQYHLSPDDSKKYL